MQPLIRFWQTTLGKIAVLGGGGLLALLSLCCACSIFGAVFGETGRTELAGEPEGNTRLRTVAAQPAPATATATATLEPTVILLPPTETPPPTATNTAAAPPPETPTQPAPATAPPPVEEQEAPAAASQFQEAQVINVVDGDTIDVLINGVEYRVRYILVDTPETKHPEKGVQPFGPEASQANYELVAGKMVRLEKDVSETDRYGRLLRYVYVDDLMVNEELLRRGLAQVATFPPDVKYVERFLAVQQEAQVAGVGLWGSQPVTEPAPTPAAPAEPPPAVTGGSLVIVAVDKRAEYVDIQNPTSQAVDLTGWRLLSEKGSQDCALGGVIQPGETLRVWAMAEDAGQGGFNCGFGSNIWNNSEPDLAVLYDSTGTEVARK